MMKVEVVVQCEEDLELLRPLVVVQRQRVLLQPPTQWPTRSLFEELQRRAAASGKQVHLVDVAGEGHTATQTGEGPPHTHTDPGGQAETTKQAEQNPAPPAGNGAARNKGFTAEAKRLWEQYQKYHQEAQESVEGTSKTQKVTKADMERWLEAHPEVIRAFAADHAPPQEGDETGGTAEPPPPPAPDAKPDSDTVVAWANVLMQHSGFDGLKAMFTRFESSNGKLSGIDESRWGEMVAAIQEQTGISALPAG